MNFDIKQLNKDVWKNIYQNKFTYYSRAVFLQLVLTTVGGFFIRLLFQLILTSSGQENITKDNFIDQAYDSDADTACHAAAVLCGNGDPGRTGTICFYKSIVIIASDYFYDANI